MSKDPTRRITAGWSGKTPTSPFFWAMISFIAGAGVMILFPLHYWMVQRGYTIPSGIAQEGTKLPGLRGSWPALLTTLGIMITMLAITINYIS